MPDIQEQVQTAPTPTQETPAQPTPAAPEPAPVAPATPAAPDPATPAVETTPKPLSSSYEDLDGFLYPKSGERAPIVVTETAVDASRAADTNAPVVEEPVIPAASPEAPAAAASPEATPVATPAASTSEEPTEQKEGARIRFDNDRDASIAALKKSRGCSWSDAEAIFDGGPIPGATPAGPTPVQTIEQEIKDIDTKLDGFDPEKEGTLFTSEIRDLQNQRASKVAALEVAKLRAEDEASDAAETERTKLVADRAASRTLALGEFPSAANKSSPLGSLVTDTIEEWSNDDHPRHRDLFKVDSPQIVINHAAKTLARSIAIQRGITVDEALQTLKAASPTPAATPAQTAASTQTPAPTPVTKKVTPASGSKRTTPAPAKRGEAEVLNDIGDDLSKIDGALGYGNRQMVIR